MAKSFPGWTMLLLVPFLAPETQAPAQGEGGQRGQQEAQTPGQSRLWQRWQEGGEWRDLFDGRTNKKGFAVYGSRQVMKNTDFNLTVFWSEPIKNSLPAYASSVPRGDRVRLQADLQFKF